MPLSLSPHEALVFIKKVEQVESVKVKDIATYEKKRAKELLVTLSEILIDWALYYELENASLPKKEVLS